MCLHHRLRSVNTGMQSQRDAHWLRALAANPDGLSSSPGICMVVNGENWILQIVHCPQLCIVKLSPAPQLNTCFFLRKKKEWYVYSANKWSYIISSCVNVNLRSWKLSLEFVNTCDSHERIKDWHRQKKMSVEKDPRDHPFQVFACVSHNKTSAQCMW